MFSEILNKKSIGEASLICEGLKLSMHSSSSVINPLNEGCSILPFISEPFEVVLGRSVYSKHGISNAC